MHERCSDVRTGDRAGTPAAWLSRSPTSSSALVRGADTCPKRMHYGPCGGVREDLVLRAGDRPCPFAVVPLPTWTGGDPRRRRRRARTGCSTGPRAARRAHRPVGRALLARVGPHVVGVLAESSDALLIGEHQSTARTCRRRCSPPRCWPRAGAPWTTLTCRDRNRVVLEQEIMGLAAVGVEGVLCATGDVRAPGVRPDVTQVFDLDGTRLAALAAAAGLVATVPEAPEAPPRDAGGPPAGAEAARRGPAVRAEPRRQPGGVARFVAAARRAGGDAAVRRGGRRLHRRAVGRGSLQAFPGLHLDGARGRAGAAAPDPVAAGIAAAVDEARALLEIPGVVGVNLSGLASARGERGGRGGQGGGRGGDRRAAGCGPGGGNSTG